MVFVYVLISSEEDFYAEQMLLSVTTLRKYHPFHKIIMLTDRETEESLQFHRQDLRLLVDEIKKVEIPGEFNRTQRSRFLKTGLTKYIKGDFIFLDTDTIVCGKLDFPVLFKGDILAVHAAHGNKLDKARFELHFQRYYTSRGTIYEENSYPVKDYFNSGVLFCRETENTEIFFNEWHNLWSESAREYNWIQDQVDFCLAKQKTGKIVKPLNGRYNCQISYSDSIRYFFKAKIIHYYSNSPSTSYFKFRNPEYLLQIRHHGIPLNLEHHLEEAFEEYKRKRKDLITRIPVAGDAIAVKIMKTLRPAVKQSLNLFQRFLNLWRSLR